MQVLTPPLLALRQCQSQAGIKEEGDTNHLSYKTVSLNSNQSISLYEALYKSVTTLRPHRTLTPSSSHPHSPSVWPSTPIDCSAEDYRWLSFTFWRDLARVISLICIVLKDSDDYNSTSTRNTLQYFLPLGGTSSLVIRTLISRINVHHYPSSIRSLEGFHRKSSIIITYVDMYRARRANAIHYTPLLSVIHAI